MGDGGGSTSEEDGEDQDHPEARAGGGLDARDAQEGDLRARVEAQAKHNPQRVHLPRPVDRAEQATEDVRKEARALQVQSAGCAGLSVIFLRAGTAAGC